MTETFNILQVNYCKHGVLWIFLLDSLKKRTLRSMGKAIVKTLRDYTP